MIVLQPVEDADEETSVLYALHQPPSKLGHVSLDVRIEFNIAGQDYIVSQRPEYTLAGKGVTGGVVWSSTPLVLEMLLQLQHTPLKCIPRQGNLTSRKSIDLTLDPQRSLVLELGSGGTGLAALVLAQHAKLFIASDFDPELLRQLSKHCCTRDDVGKRVKIQRREAIDEDESKLSKQRRDNIRVLELNWEDDFATQVKPSIVSLLAEEKRALHDDDDEPSKVDYVLCLDCVYSSYLLVHLVSTVAAILKLYPDCKAILGQQLRDQFVHLEFIEQLLARGLLVHRLEEDDDDASSAAMQALDGYAIYIVSNT
ncbi:hypothetical protein BCR37DRAFT_275785 [Protomyces lactucae-debilis]|uniref:Methyltransferase-domain-containing protein n=1 Tax=Protomyces lactucae-debilis TaxID=2754530 RepID=A0A1Y2FIA9_PROLT|nr:uncharacterized protein BCR37DRAFT_275785 [Protomyces lactucae-debilis]ORY83663.1 hypothetical protein BCR37DRAFT_275785 [Protomyces lactucae-debilis]